MTLREVAEPSPLPHELLVRVETFASNSGDLAALPGAPVGSIPGWDGAGLVLEAAADDGAGPHVGDRVVFLGLGARGWAQRRAVPHAATAAAPSDAAWEHLATLPVPAPARP
ncbi:alcohol dehydrogenase catalytic domain-containing protein [Streptosporangium sp. NPDC000509]|uniref:alcohol dehydrogenase catalytic domain-containing protein n=1 Tax=Streptosporangium sp. NPDC000509 TaxID=3366186 RepID=UPI0036C8E7DA